MKQRRKEYGSIYLLCIELKHRNRFICYAQGQSTEIDLFVMHRAKAQKSICLLCTEPK